MAIAPDEKELLTEDSYDVVGTMVHEYADVAPDMTANEELWQEDTATSMDKKEHATEQQKRAEQGINYPVAGWLILLHVGALAAPFCFSWEALVVCLVLYWFNGSIGVCLGYHRLLTHGAFKVHKVTRWSFGAASVN